MKMEKRKFRIGALAQQLNVERFVIRFWEKEFNFKGSRSGGGQRFYDENDLKKFKTIKELLYEKKFTIAGAKQFFQKHPNNNLVASSVTTLDDVKQAPDTKKNDKKLYQKLVQLRQKLLDFKKSL